MLPNGTSGGFHEQFFWCPYFLFAKGVFFNANIQELLIHISTYFMGGIFTYIYIHYNIYILYNIYICIYLNEIWVNYNDLTATSLE